MPGMMDKHRQPRITGRRVREVTKFEVLRKISGIEEFSSLVFYLARKSDTVEALTKDLSTELSEEGLQTIKSVAQAGNYPLSFDGIQ